MITVLTIDDFDKAEEIRTRSNKRVIKMTPKEPIAGLDGLEISVFVTTWKQGDSEIWGWEWSGGRGLFYSSLGKDGGPPQESHFSLQSAANAAIKSASYWSDDERLPREELERQESIPDPMRIKPCGIPASLRFSQ